MELEAPPGPQEVAKYQEFRDKKHLEEIVLKELFRGLRVQCRGYLERPSSIESAIDAEDVAMRVEVQEIAEG